MDVALKDYRHGKWYNAKKFLPDDSRDVVAWVVKPVVVKLGEKPRLKKVLCIVCFEGGFWYDDPNPRANVVQWTEIPDGWEP
jgi:hypothetical protein